MFRNLLSLCSLVVMGLVGCSSAPDDQPETGPVTGVVLLDDKPLPNARVLFSPTSGGQSSEGTTDENGKFELRYKRDIWGQKSANISSRFRPMKSRKLVTMVVQLAAAWSWCLRSTTRHPHLSEPLNLKIMSLNSSSKVAVDCEID